MYDPAGIAVSPLEHTLHANCVAQHGYPEMYGSPFQFSPMPLFSPTSHTSPVSPMSQTLPATRSGQDYEQVAGQFHLDPVYTEPLRHVTAEPRWNSNSGGRRRRPRFNRNDNARRPSGQTSSSWTATPPEQALIVPVPEQGNPEFEAVRSAVAIAALVLQLAAVESQQPEKEAEGRKDIKGCIFLAASANVACTSREEQEDFDPLDGRALTCPAESSGVWAEISFLA